MTTIPYSQQAEESVLGAVLIHPQAIYGVRGMLRVEDFYLVRNGYVWGALCALAERDEAIDNVTVCRELEARGQLDAVGGPAYITTLMANTPSSVHAEIYAGLVRRTSMRRKLLVLGDEIKTLAVDENRGLSDVMADISGRVFSAVSEHDQRDASWYEVVSAFTERMISLWDHPGDTLGVPTGHKGIDAHMLGLQPSELIYVCGRPGMGKTVVLLQWAIHAALAGYRVAIWSGEMSAQQMVQRGAAHLSGISQQVIRGGRMSNEERRAFMDALGRMSELPITLWTQAGLRPGELEMKVLEAQARGGLDAVFVDYLGLMRGDERTRDKYHEVSAISWSLKSMANRCKLPVVAGVQLSRDVEKRQDKRPQLHDLRDSGSLEQDADVVFGLYREGAYDEAAMDPAKIEMAQLKYRHGEPRTFYGRFDGATSRISEAEVRRVRIE